MNHDDADQQFDAVQDWKIDEILASDAFETCNKPCDDSKAVAFRVLGAIFQLDPSRSSDQPFQAQIRRVLPGKNSNEYDELYCHALAEWVEVYGY
jgi:hypothetical protein